MSGRAFSLVEVDSIKTKFIISMNRIKKQPRESQSLLSLSYVARASFTGSF